MNRRLPRSLEELRGRRAARWIRESTVGQEKNFGPDAQREQQDRAIERYGLVDTGVGWQVAHSGRTIATTSQWGAMLAAAGEAYDVLVVGYVSRFARELEAAVTARRAMHAAGAAILFADEGVLSSDEDQWERWAREAVEAEAYSRRLGKRIREGYAAKFRRLADQAGSAPLGFLRSSAPPHVLVLDPSSIGRAVRVFELYAAGSLSMRELAAQTGLEYERVVKILRNPLYNGWVRRHRGRDEERAPAPWRSNPPVSDDLWRRCADLRASRIRGGGPSTRNHEDLLRGLVVCGGCGRRLRASGTSGNPPRRVTLHPEPCEAWGPVVSFRAEHWEDAVAGQLGSIELDEVVIDRIRTVLSAPVAQPIDPTKARLERRMRDLAADHLANRLTDAAYLEQLRVLRAELAEAERPRRSTIDVDEAIASIADMAALWCDATLEQRAQLAHAVYARIPVLRERFLPVTLTPAAYEIGLDQAMAELVRVAVVSPAGARAARQTRRIPILGRRERLLTARRSA